MADELQLVSINAASDSWVDTTPGAISTGYQAQNVAMAALFNGIDKSSVRISGANCVIDPSGLIDDSGLPFVVSDTITIALPTSGASDWFLAVVAGSTSIERSIEFQDSRGTYVAAKNGFYNGDGERVLNWRYNVDTKTLIRLADSNINPGNEGAIESVNTFCAISDLMYSRWKIPGRRFTRGTTTTSIAYDYANDRILLLAGTTVYCYNAITGAEITTIALAGTSATIGSITVDNRTGNLIAHDAVSPYELYIFNGISNTLSSQFNTDEADSICIDPENNRVLLGDNGGVSLIVHAYNLATGAYVSDVATGLSSNGYITWDSINNNLIFSYALSSGVIRINDGYTTAAIATVDPGGIASEYGIGFDHYRGCLIIRGTDNIIYSMGYCKY